MSEEDKIACTQWYDRGRKEAIKEFLEVINKWLSGDYWEYEYLDDSIEYWRRERMKWEAKQNE